METRSINVSLPPDKAADIIRHHLVSSSYIHDEAHFLGDKTVRVLVFEKYYLRTTSSVGLTVIIKGDSKSSLVTAVSSAGGQGVLNIDWGASYHFCTQVINLLSMYSINEDYT